MPDDQDHARQLQTQTSDTRRWDTHPNVATTSKPKPIIKSKDRSCIVDSGASLHMMGERSPSLSAGKENHRFIAEARVYIQEPGTYLCVELVEDSPSVSFRTMVR